MEESLRAGAPAGPWNDRKLEDFSMSSALGSWMASDSKRRPISYLSPIVASMNASVASSALSVASRVASLVEPMKL